MSEKKQITDFDNPRVDANEMLNFMKRYNKNQVHIAGTVTGMDISNPSPKIDKKTNLPVLDADGQPEFWEPFYSVTISFEGGLTKLNLSEKLFGMLRQNERFLFIGSLGQAFGKVQPVFYEVQEIA